MREQRKELALTRNEFELNRAVMVEQAKEAKKQAEYISTQTQLLLEEAHARKRQETLTSFTILVSRFIEYTREYAKDSYYRSGGNTGTFLHAAISQKVGDERYIDEQSEWIRASIEATGANIKVLKPEIFENSFIYIYSAEELIEKLPYHSRVSWKRSRIHAYLNVCCDVISRSPEFEHLKKYVDARDRRLSAGLGEFELTFPSLDD